jgi:hypothetical protein
MKQNKHTDTEASVAQGSRVLPSNDYTTIGWSIQKPKRERTVLPSASFAAIALKRLDNLDGVWFTRVL